MFRRLALALSLALLPFAALATPVPYKIDPAASSVGFEASFGPDKITGTMPLGKVHLTLDFQDVRRSTIAVTLRPRGATASFPFAAQAMKGPKVLDTQAYPTIHFRSTEVSKAGNADNAALIHGNVTIRGVTKPVTLEAQLYQVAGSAPGDYRKLTIKITGAIKRSEFGADGWPNMVGDEVKIAILARIDRIE